MNNIMNSYREIETNKVSANGWLYEYLNRQKKGLTGQLDTITYPFNTATWSSNKDQALYEANWWPYEQVGYWIDGMQKCGYILDDQDLVDKANKYMQFVLDNPDEDGYLGPQFMKQNKKDKRWSHAVLFRSMITRYLVTKEESILNKLSNHYLGEKDDNVDGRNICNIEIILWLYEETKDVKLLDKAIQLYELYNEISTEETTIKAMLSDKKPSIHGVTYNEIAKLGVLMYKYTGKEEYLDATKNAYEKLDKMCMLVDGVHSSSEYIRGNDVLDSHETCDIADYTWAVGYLYQITKEAKYGDAIERACFNAAPGAIKKDFTALQYVSCPNQVISNTYSNHNEYFKGNTWMSYRPKPGIECCTGNVNRIMPNYVSKMWMLEDENTIVAALYGPSSITHQIGGENISIIQDTNYPFEDIIKFKIELENIEELDFNLKLRIPGWTKGYKIFVNGNISELSKDDKGFCTLSQIFKDKDVITLELSSEITTSNWSNQGITIEKGPLVYALKIDEKWEVTNDQNTVNKAFPDYNVYPMSPWNYGIAESKELIEEIKVVRNENDCYPWDVNNAPITLQVPATVIKNWTTEKTECMQVNYDDDVEEIKYETIQGEFEFTPPIPTKEEIAKLLNEEKTNITLVPYGCTSLRVTIFPII